ncbi:MAG TPA: hypothetical protein DCX03_07930 [Bacteroidales bacterium]|nr:hypothetical protein [Bacteroidales bacterium]
MISITKSSQIIFLLGAGASKNAEVPTTYEFVTQFIEHVDETRIQDYRDQYDELELITLIVETLEKWKGESGEKVDIELLLETLTKFKNRSRESLLQFCDNRESAPIIQFANHNICLNHLDELIEHLISDLKNFIKSKTIVKEEKKIEYLKPFRGFIETAKSKGGPLDIISLNYDTCIEQFCNVHKMTYQDGFDLYWNPEAFKREESDIRLYKLHGSVIWYQSDKGTYIKLPIQNEIRDIKLISDEKAENLMLYPMQKWDYAEPLLELLLHIKDLLESKVSVEEPVDNFKFLIIVGYSFRDEHIKKVIWDAARKNRRLYLIIIDPEANEIYKRLKYYDNSEKIESHLVERVICLPYKFEKVFPSLMDNYLNNLKKGLLEVDAAQKQEDLAKEPRWKDCLIPLAKAEFSEKVINIINNNSIIFEEIQPWEEIPIHLPIAINLLYNNQKDEANKYLNRFRKATYKYYKKQSENWGKYGGNLNCRSNFDMTYRFNNNFEDFYETTKNILDHCEIRLNNLCVHKDENLKEIVEKMKICIGYTEIISNIQRNEIKLNLQEYIKERKELIDSVERSTIIADFEEIKKDLSLARNFILNLESIVTQPYDSKKQDEIKNAIDGIEKQISVEIIDKILNPESGYTHRSAQS